MQKCEFPKMGHYVGFLQVGSNMASILVINKALALQRYRYLFGNILEREFVLINYMLKYKFYALLCSSSQVIKQSMYVTF